ncbi:peptidase inhibitor family I36 protein [Streptomyces ovatisporus]|uniref:Peptidase inhibitor family I36 protein n=1 Tax=Streptomyces ovatisporus TaxID=1128682 RepID=A0ABV9A0A9_9ACTN
MSGPAAGKPTRPGRTATARSVAIVLALAAASAGGPVSSAAAAAAPVAQSAAVHRDATKLGECAAGEVCLWQRKEFRGDRRTYELSGVSTGSCERLPKGMSAQSFANRTGRPVTVYQSEECAETGEFHTHPSGAWTPEAAYRVRALKVWER